MSSSSTIPSSTDISNDSHTNSIASGKRPSPDLPAHAPRLRGWSLKNAGRTFSFANKQKDEVPPVPSYPVLPSQTITPDPAVVPKRRERAMTASTASTATPPKLLDGDLALGESDMDNFGNMFDSIGNQNNRVSASPNGFPQMVRVVKT